MMRSSYLPQDVCILLKDITGLLQPLDTAKREKLIQSGTHYSEMLPLEYTPSEKYMLAYTQALKTFTQPTADAIARLAALVMAHRDENVVLVSLARAGIPIGILLKRYLEQHYHLSAPHYAISIIRGKGIDQNAMAYILARHSPQSLLFVDGWIGKGAILRQLREALLPYPEVSPQLAVASDPAGMTELCGTREDILIPSSCLNSTVSGLISRTVLRDDIIGKSDFHGAVYYENLKSQDLSYQFIEEIQSHFPPCPPPEDSAKSFGDGYAQAQEIASELGISDINFIKPGIGETTRVLLRRVPWRVLVRQGSMDDPALSHILRLAEEKNVPIAEYPLKSYKACGIIRELADT